MYKKLHGHQHWSQELGHRSLASLYNFCLLVSQLVQGLRPLFLMNISFTALIVTDPIDAFSLNESDQQGLLPPSVKVAQIISMCFSLFCMVSAILMIYPSILESAAGPLRPKPSYVLSSSSMVDFLNEDCTATPAGSDCSTMPVGSAQLMQPTPTSTSQCSPTS